MHVFLYNELYGEWLISLVWYFLGLDECLGLTSLLVAIYRSRSLLGTAHP